MTGPAPGAPCRQEASPGHGLRSGIMFGITLLVLRRSSPLLSSINLFCVRNHNNKNLISGNKYPTFYNFLINFLNIELMPEIFAFKFN